MPPTVNSHPGAPSVAVFLDRDGVLNRLVTDPKTGVPESPLAVADVDLIPGAAEGAAMLRDAGYVLVVVSNQPAAAKGTIDLAVLDAVHTRVLELMARAGAPIDYWRLCLHHPRGVVPELSGPCDCRKPAPGMLLAAAEELHLELSRSWMVGDTDADIEAGRAAGCRAVLIEHAPSAHKRSGGTKPDAVAIDLLDASRRIVSAGVR